MLELKGVGTVSFAVAEMHGTTNYDCAMEQVEAIILGYADPVIVK